MQQLPNPTPSFPPREEEDSSFVEAPASERDSEGLPPLGTGGPRPLLQYAPEGSLGISRPHGAIRVDLPARSSSRPQAPAAKRQRREVEEAKVGADGRRQQAPQGEAGPRSPSRPGRESGAASRRCPQIPPNAQESQASTSPRVIQARGPGGRFLSASAGADDAGSSSSKNPAHVRRLIGDEKWQFRDQLHPPYSKARIVAMLRHLEAKSPLVKKALREAGCSEPHALAALAERMVLKESREDQRDLLARRRGQALAGTAGCGSGISNRAATIADRIRRNTLSMGTLVDSGWVTEMKAQERSQPRGARQTAPPRP